MQKRWRNYLISDLRIAGIKGEGLQKPFSEKSLTTCRSTTLNTAQVNRQIKPLVMPFFDRTYRDSVNFTPVTENGIDSWTLNLSKGAGSGALKAIPCTFRQVTHRRRSFLTYCRMKLSSMFDVA